MIARRTRSAAIAGLLLVGVTACSSASDTASSSPTIVSSTSAILPTVGTPTTGTPTTGGVPAPEPPVASPTSDSPTSDSPTSDSPTTESARPASRTCVVPTNTTPVNAVPFGAGAADSTAPDRGGQDWNITSFDGTVIRAHWFPVPRLGAGATAPTVLMGPGWGSAGDTKIGSVGGDANIASLQLAGFNVLTWDPRGFGQSKGMVEVDSPDFEGRDVQQLLDWVSTQPQVQLDATRDPRVGMVGASYGGGIQLITAAIDCRIDAIVPIIAWHSLQTSLFKADTPKTGWAGFLAAVATGRQLDPTIGRSDRAGLKGVVDPADVQWFADRGPGDLVAKIDVPTLIIQGTVDTLFTLQEGADNYAALLADHVPVSMLWFCGGHGACLTPPGNTSRSGAAAIAWLRHYVKGEMDVAVGSAFEFVDQSGVSYTADQFPPTPTTPFTATGSGTLQLVAGGGAGPATLQSAAGLAPLIAPITPGKAANAVNVDIPMTAPGATAPIVIVGAPELKLSYAGTVPAGSTPTRVFAQLFDNTTGLVVGNQITPIKVTLDGQTHTTSVPLEMIAFTAYPSNTMTLQIVATTVAYATPRLGGSIVFQSIDVSLPAVSGVTAVTG